MVSITISKGLKYCHTFNCFILFCSFVLQVLQIASDIFQEKLTTAARKLYIHRYSTEVELNFNFKKFVHNYQAAFDGKNTKRHQLFYARNKKSVSKTESK